ncbi:MAG: hypothetical protein GXO83_03715 [Chlorobi bacterium]|nr:hypothetical protein [Chlorobiota bacterium]
MKKLSLFFGSALLIASLLFSGCEKNPAPGPGEDSILPQSFKVDIPDAISRQASTNKSATVDTLKGNDIYEHLANFINIGEGAAGIVQDVIGAITVYHINKPMSFSFQSDDDGRTKNVTVVANSSYDNATWEFQMTITDAESEGNDDGGKAIQIFWNRDPVEGIALLKPYNIDRRNDGKDASAMFRIDYSETGDHGYDAHMLVYIAGLPVADPLEDPYSMSALKMFVGKKGDYVDVYGNSNHPNATFFAGHAGFNWAFVAAGNGSDDIGVAEVGLPPSNLDEPSRSVLLGYYSIKDVFTREIMEVWPGIDPASIEAFLYNTSAPGFFDAAGFVSGGTSPGSQYDDLVARIQDLSPYNPKEISNLVIAFKD